MEDCWQPMGRQVFSAWKFLGKNPVSSHKDLSLPEFDDVASSTGSSSGYESGVRKPVLGELGRPVPEGSDTTSDDWSDDELSGSVTLEEDQDELKELRYPLTQNKIQEEESKFVFIDKVVDKEFMGEKRSSMASLQAYLHCLDFNEPSSMAQIRKHVEANKNGSTFSLTSVTSQSSLNSESAVSTPNPSGDEMFQFSHKSILKYRQVNSSKRRLSAFNNRNAEADNRSCYTCHEAGHLAHNCPQSGEDDNCPNCKEVYNHQARICPLRLAGLICNRCKQLGHIARNCTNEPKSEALKTGPVTYIPQDFSGFVGISQGSNFHKYDDIPVTVSGPGAESVKSIESFQDAGLQHQILQNVLDENYEKPTPVQRYAIPVINEGRNLMACAQTGSGKTLAFVLPIISGILKNGVDSSFPKSPLALILSPTRELATQTHKHVERFSRSTEITSVLLYGGTSIKYNVGQIEQGCHIVIATPGRLLDLVHKQEIQLSKVRFFVLDEADRMLDMGFEPEIRKIQDKGMMSKTQRQTLLFSATFPEAIQKMADDLMHAHLFLAVGIIGQAHEDIKQKVFSVEASEKRERLIEILNELTGEKVLVFVEQKRRADFLASWLSQTGFPTTSIHGDREQPQREEALRDFRTKKNPILIATNVAARGLDIPEVEMVVNYDLPSSIDEYVHRVGRTGRCGNTGKAITFFNKSNETDRSLARDIVRQLRNSSQMVPEWLETVADEAHATGGPIAFVRDARRRRTVSAAAEIAENWDDESLSKGHLEDRAPSPLEQEESWD